MSPRLDQDSKTVRTQLVSTQKFIDRVDDWRRLQKGIPSKSEAIRHLVEVGLGKLEREPLLSLADWRRISDAVGTDAVNDFVREAVEKALREREEDMDAISP